MVNWFVETEVFDSRDITSLKKAILDSGANYFPMTYNQVINYKKTLYEEYKGFDKPSLYYGSIQGSKLTSAVSYYPWQNLSWYELKCSSYYPVLDKELFNNEYFFIPFNAITPNKQRLYQQLRKNSWVYDNDEIFIRPDSNDKVFTGTKVRYDKLENWAKDEVLFRKLSNELCLLAPIKKVLYEVRAIVVDRNVIDVSQYSDYEPGYSDVLKDKGKKKSIIDYLIPIIKNPKLLPSMHSFSIDVTEDSKGVYKILEVGSVNTSGMYDVDYEKIVKAMNAKALEEFKEFCPYPPVYMTLA